MSKENEQKAAKYAFLGETQVEKVRLLQEDLASSTRNKVAATISQEDAELLSPEQTFRHYYQGLSVQELSDEEKTLGLHNHSDIAVPDGFKKVVSSPESKHLKISEAIFALLQNPATSAETLHQIAIGVSSREDATPDVYNRRLIIEHPNVSAKTLDFISKCESKKNKLIIIDHPKVQAETLQAMAENDPDKNVREAARKKLEENA